MEEDLNIDLDTEKLISLIKDQPAVYDRTLPPLGQKEKTILWLNICKELIPGWEERPQLEKTQIGIEVYSRWKNLRNCFRREYNLQKEEAKAHRHGNPFIQRKRKKYEFYDHLHFLLPTGIVKKNSSKSPQKSMQKEQKMTSRAVSPGVFQDTPMSPASQPNAPGQSAHQYAPGQPTPQFASGQPTPQFASGQATQQVPPCQAAQPNIPRPTVDEDRHFLLSVLPALQRMSRSQKLKAKMKFLQALSDVDAEAREKLRRYVCFRPVSDQEYNLPEPNTGGGMQPDHTYYLVREKGIKRARMVPLSDQTAPHQKFEAAYYQDYAVYDDLPETAEDAKSHESIEIGHPQGSAEVAKSNQNVEFGSLQQTGTGNLQENVEVGGSQELVEAGSSQDTAAVGNVEKNSDVDIVQTTVEVADSKDTVEDGSSKDTVEDGGSKDTVEVGDSKDTVDVGDSKGTVEVGDSKGTVENGSTKYPVADGGSKDTVEDRGSKDTVEDGNSQVNIKVGNVQVHAEVGNLEDNVEVFNVQENVESGGEPMDIAVVKDEFMLQADV